MSSSFGPGTAGTTASPSNGTDPDVRLPAEFDMSLVLIWLIAVVTLVIGAHWSGKVRHSLYLRNRARSLEDGQPEEDRDGGAKKKKRKSDQEEEQFLNISALYVLFFVCCMAVMLLALYYFFSYLVYVIIALFVLASVLSTFVCVSPVVKALLPKTLAAVEVPCGSRGNRVAVFQAVVLLFSVCLSVAWLVVRKKSVGWVLQDILGVFFSINMLRTIRLPSFRICTILLSLLFLYDIFFVFLTPYITSSGKSVMVEVATGGSRGEESGPGDGTGTPRETLPMVLTVPHFSWRQSNASDPSHKPAYSLLGFGDILVPGLLVSYCHAFDLIHEIPFRPYFVASSVAYGLGLIITFVGLFLMKGLAQPALLYLVPCTLIAPLSIACYRREVKQLWDGPGDGAPDDKKRSSKAEITLLRDEQIADVPPPPLTTAAAI